MKGYNLIICVSAALLIFSCRKLTPPGPPNMVELNRCIQGSVEGQNVSLCLDKVIEDSRCPLNVDCIWSGRALAKFTFTANNHAESFVLVAYRSMPPYSADTTIDGFKIKFVNLLPYPSYPPQQGQQMQAEVEISK